MEILEGILAIYLFFYVVKGEGYFYVVFYNFGGVIRCVIKVSVKCNFFGCARVLVCDSVDVIVVV